MIKSLTILGSTGSIGLQAIEICDLHQVQIAGIAFNSNVELAFEQIKKYKIKYVSVKSEKAAQRLMDILASTKIDCQVFVGQESIKSLLQVDGAEMVLNAISGMAGLVPSFYVIKSRRDLALANKETLVGAGRQILDLAKENDVEILPVDSEHSAILQSAQSFDLNDISKIFLTCSGGPFRNWTKEELNSAKAKDALKHPTWNMGRKITIDSATLMNKGLEVIEACHLFNKKTEDIEVVIHPESILHSAILYKDGACIGQMGFADMKIPIQYALTHGKRINSPSENFSFFDERSNNLHFYEVDNERFPLLNFAKDCFNLGKYYPLILNAANEVAVESFLQDKIAYNDIYKLCYSTVNTYAKSPIEESLAAESIMELETKYRQVASRLIEEDKNITRIAF